MKNSHWKHLGVVKLHGLKPSGEEADLNKPFCMGRTKLRPDQGLETGSSQVGPSSRIVLFAGVLETESQGLSIRTQCRTSHHGNPQVKEDGVVYKKGGPI